VKNRKKHASISATAVPSSRRRPRSAAAFVSESVNYLDIGLKLEVEPNIYLEDDVGISMGLEVSNILSEVRGSSGNTLAYQIGTRNTNTVLRLHDGETQVLAGLISDEDRRTASRVPGSATCPFVGRLFSQTSENKVKTEIVLLITPHLIRTLKRPDARTAEFSAGTETSIEGAGPLGAGPVLPPSRSPLPRSRRLPLPLHSACVCAGRAHADGAVRRRAVDVAAALKARMKTRMIPPARRALARVSR